MKDRFKNIKDSLGSNYVTNLIAIAALGLSILASIFSYSVYKENQKEQINISSERIQDGYFVDIDTSIVNLVSIPTLWECIITNNGQQTVSLIDKEIKLINSDGAIIYYSGLDLGIIKDNKYFSFPINIPAGESEKFYLKIGVLMDSCAVRALIRNSENMNELTVRKIQYYLAKDSIDVFGNKIESQFQKDKLILFSLPKEYKQTRYIAEFRTGRGSLINVKLNWYPDFTIE